MPARQKHLITLVVFLTVVGLVVIASRGINSISLLKQSSPSASLSKPAPDAGYNEVATITYDGKSFSPSTVTAKINTVLAASASAKPQDKPWIKIVNNSKDVLDIVSSEEELNSFGVISGGEFKIMPISKVGTFTYHDKTHTDQGGTVVVQGS